MNFVPPCYKVGENKEIQIMIRKEIKVMEIKFAAKYNLRGDCMIINGSKSEENIVSDVLHNMNISFYGMGGDKDFSYVVNVQDENDYLKIKKQLDNELKRYETGVKNTEHIQKVDLSTMTEKEKEAYIEAVEIMIDYGDSNLLSDEEFELYNQLIAERSQLEKNANEKAALDEVISSAEKRRDEQNEIDTEQIEREAR